MLDLAHNMGKMYIKNAEINTYKNGKDLHV